MPTKSQSPNGNGAGHPYSDFLTRPVWPKAHRTRLEASYTGSTAEELQAESSSRERHLPGRQSVSTGSNRHAGVSGEAYSGGSHPDDFDNVKDQDQGLVQAVIDGLNSSKDLPDSERQELLKSVQDAYDPEQVRQDFQKLFKDPRIVISAREAKELTPDYACQPGHSQKHGYARYVLPISESELKEQEWPGKEEQKQKKEKEDAEKQEPKKQKEGGDNASGANGTATDKKDDTNGDTKQDTKQASASSKSGGVHVSDQKVNREQDSGVENGDPVENLTPEQRRFFDALVEEAKQINAFQNADGAPAPIEDADPTAQVGFEIQVDDQFTPDVSQVIAQFSADANANHHTFTELDTPVEPPEAIDRKASIEC